MGSLSFAEIVTILLVILVIFGPNRLPEFARKLGELMAQARRATSQFSKDISSEWGDAVEPLMDVKKDFDGVKQDLKDATASLTGFGAAEDAAEDHRPQTTDHRPEAEDDASQTSVPLSRGTGETASQGDEGSASDRRGTEEERSDDSEGLGQPEATDDGSETHEASEPDANGRGAQGADKEMGES